VNILEAISNNVSAMPAMSSAGLAGLGQRGTGGFASTLAAAQAESTSPEEPEVGVPAEKIVQETAGSNLNAKSTGSVPGKKPVSVAALPVANSLAAGSVAVPASQIVGLTSQTSQVLSVTDIRSQGTQPGQPASGSALAVANDVSAESVVVPGSQVSQLLSGTGSAALQGTQPLKPLTFTATGIANHVAAESATAPASQIAGSASQANPLASVTETASVQNSGRAGGSAASSTVATAPPAMTETSILATGASAAGVVSGVGDSSAGVISAGGMSLSSGIRSQLTGSGSESAVVRGQPIAVVPAEAAANSNVDLSNATPAIAATANAATANAAQRIQTNGFEDAMPAASAQPILVAESSVPSALAFPTELPRVDTTTSTAHVAQSAVPQSGAVPQASALEADSVLYGSTQAVPPQTFPTAARPAIASSVLPANASSENISAAGVAPLLTAKPQITNLPSAGFQIASLQSDPANDLQTLATSAQSGNNVPSPTSAPGVSSLFGIVSASNPALSMLSSLAQPLAAKILGRSVPSKANAAAPAAPVRGASASASSLPSSGLETDSEAGAGVPVASQSPFSIFFSNPGPGTESAASALPKMILPAASAASHVMPISPSANSQGTGAQANLSPSTVQPTGKDSLSGTASGNLQASQSLHPDAITTNASAVVAQVAGTSASATATAAPAPPASAPVAVIAAVQSNVPADTPLKQNPLPAGSQASSAVAVQPPPPTAAPGPVQVAQMVNRMGQSEMRVGMNTSAFGDVEVRTTVHASDVGLTIGSEKGDLRGMLANDMPAITNTLQQQNLRLNNVSFTQGSGFSNHSSGGGDGSQQRSFVPHPASTNYESSSGTSAATAAEDFREVLPPAALGGAGSSLSILA
jgi:flagellar hook-length control protein FliK